MFGLFKKADLPIDGLPIDGLPIEKEAIPGRGIALRVAEKHAVLGNSMSGPFPKELEMPAGQLAS